MDDRYEHCKDIAHHTIDSRNRRRRSIWSSSWVVSTVDMTRQGLTSDRALRHPSSTFETLTSL